jgi:polyhydroxyalkanoate synthesis regulator phasin
LAMVMLFISAPSESAQVDRVATLERKVHDLELEFTVMGGDLNQLKFDRTVDSDSVQGFQDSVDEVRHAVDEDTKNIEKLRSDLDELSKRVSTLEDKLPK